MSGDVQPRKRKDKKRKRDSLDRKSEGDLIFSRKSSLQSEEEEIIHHGVHATKMGTEDVHLHVQSEHGTGGNWCAKIFFFSLMAILIGLVGLIIMENRGLSDLDTPLQESRFSEYFEGWVDEYREEHHDDHNIVAHEIEEHDLHDEPFEEVDENDSHGDVDDDDNEDEDDVGERHDTEEDDDDEENNITNEAEDPETAEDDDDADEDDETAEDDNNDTDDLNQDNDDENNIEASYTKINREAQLDQQPKLAQHQQKQDDDDENEIDDNESDDDEDDDDDKKNKEDDDPFDEEEYDGTFESLEENVVDNDAEELSLLRKKADQASKNSNAADSEENSSTPLAVKIIVGLALAIVARLVLIKKRPEDVTRRSSIDEANLIEQIHMNEDRKHSTEPLQNKDNEPVDDYYGDEDEEIYSDNEYVEEEIEEIEEEEEEHEINELKNILNTEWAEDLKTYIPETFEQLNAMYRPIKNVSVLEKDPSLQVDVKLQTSKIIEFKPRFDEHIKSGIFTQAITNIENLNKSSIQPGNSNEKSSESVNIVGKKFTKIPSPTEQIDNSIQEKIIAAKLAASTAQPECLIESDEYADDADDDDILDEDENYEEEIEEEEEDDECEELSDDGDEELMKRLEAKYGKLPVNFDSDEEQLEEEEGEDSSWTKIEPRTGGPQSYDNDDSIEEELKRAEEQMSQKNFKAGLKIYESLALKYPDYPKALYGKAIALDTISTIMESTDMLKQSIIAYQRYLALDELIPDEEFKNASYYCINQMRSINHYNSAISIHLALINRFDDDPKSRNELVITYLHLDRLSDAKALVEINLSRWPDNGVALVNYGYILLQSDSLKDLEKGVHYLQLGIETNEIGTQEQLFYSLLGLNLIRLDREHEGREIFRKAVAKKLFISEYQRPFLYNKNLKGQPFWTKNETGYTDLFNLFEYNWRKIRDEAVSVLTEKEYFENENANLTEFGNWKFFSLFTYGNKILKNCKKTPFTCALLEFFLPARHCTIGVIKFSVIHPGTHIKPHCGANNYRLRAHLGLVIPRDTTIRVVEEKRNWKEGEFLIFDDSFEHEVWHNGTSLRLILLIDVWHPQVTREEKILLKHAPTNFNSKWVSRLNRVE